MLRPLRSFTNATVKATDGEIGSVEQFYFDDQKWTIRYLVINTGGWLTGRKVLISPIAVGRMEPMPETIRISLTRKQIEGSPNIETEKPVSRQMEMKYHDYYRWPYYWTGAGIWGMAPYPAGMLGQVPISPTQPDPLSDSSKEQGDDHLRSTHAVTGYRIEASDGRFGHVEDFIIDDESWSIRYLIIDTINFWPSKSVLISPQWVDSISWAGRKFRINVTEDKIKKAPEFHPNTPISREYEEKLHDHYGRPKYWGRDSRDSTPDSSAA
ncbi:MAG: hypothetical protein A2428_10265 [Bdellovibrionales bacterium RIFOXYC1_FULL_54_43]|nr:MAG: hypothetical protein A2428_10265 [Bdellovibrionales bacterium RIFOXYC1_FULL_54_43]OFZ80545.1 MAG: hypothetical protein A2603_12990 [Bdellovibrionales bacterium RIFOXYD1_FULL_55_31]